MTHLDFLSPDLAAPEAVWRSPLERPLAHAPAGIEDVSRTGVLDVRGGADGLDAGGAEIVRLSDDRALVLCDWERVAEVRARLGDRATLDFSAGWAGIRLPGETLLRRLTDLDLDALPAVGPVAHVQALVLRDEDGAFRVFFAQEYGDYLAEVVLDAAAGLEAP